MTSSVMTGGASSFFGSNFTPSSLPTDEFVVEGISEHSTCELRSGDVIIIVELVVVSCVCCSCVAFTIGIA